MRTIAALSTGTKVMLGAAILLVADLFMTWQTFRFDYGPRYEVPRSLDGWDSWGLLMGTLVVVLFCLVILRQLEDEFAEGSSWELVSLIVAALLPVIAVVKTARDSESAWASYVGVALALLVVVGAFVDWWTARGRDRVGGVALRASPVGLPEDGPSVAEPGDVPGSRW